MGEIIARNTLSWLKLLIKNLLLLHLVGCLYYCEGWGNSSSHKWLLDFLKFDSVIHNLLNSDIQTLHLKCPFCHPVSCTFVSAALGCSGTRPTPSPPIHPAIFLLTNIYTRITGAVREVKRLNWYVSLHCHVMLADMSCNTLLSALFLWKIQIRLKLEIESKR